MIYKVFTKINDDIINIRTKVFIEEQHFVNEFDEIDNHCIFIVVYDNLKPIATGRLYNDVIDKHLYHIGRLAVCKESRSKGVGSYLLSILEAQAIKLNAKFIKISSQVRASDFYKANGYIEEGQIYFDEKVEHIDMIKYLL